MPLSEACFADACKACPEGMQSCYCVCHRLRYSPPTRVLVSCSIILLLTSSALLTSLNLRGIKGGFDGALLAGRTAHVLPALSTLWPQGALWLHAADAVARDAAALHDRPGGGGNVRAALAGPVDGVGRRRLLGSPPRALAQGLDEAGPRALEVARGPSSSSAALLQAAGSPAPAGEAPGALGFWSTVLAVATGFSLWEAFRIRNLYDVGWGWRVLLAPVRYVVQRARRVTHGRRAADVGIGPVESQDKPRSRT